MVYEGSSNAAELNNLRETTVFLSLFLNIEETAVISKKKF